MELWNNITRYLASEGRWYTLDNCYQATAGAGYIDCIAAFDCYHPSTIRDYRGEASAYSIVNGVGYFATNTSETTANFCG
jgi:hypothetical protein